MGRHLLGSEIFDYWRDPWGLKHEHYADGDLFDASQPAGYHKLDREGLYQWGPDLPDNFVAARPRIGQVASLLRGAIRRKCRCAHYWPQRAACARLVGPGSDEVTNDTERAVASIGAQPSASRHLAYNVWR